MAISREKNLVKSTIYVVQDNIFLRQMVTQMVKFISETGILSFSTEKRTQEYMVRNYFRSLSLDAISQKGYKMGFGTPWGDEATDLVKEDDDYEEEFNEEEDDS